ncbi:MAG TPA: HAMP domain-containing sensor histidine kinase [Candidatus Limnocylindria bacterium]|nr:HAMP domain-containing sensor histidine kinase [Candidatus Limnocylindria bacterium]
MLALATVALIALVVSGLTLNLRLPDLFTGQSEDRAQVAAASTGLLIRDTAARLIDPSLLLDPELRNTQVLLPVARAAANTLAQGTVSIYQGDDLVAQASPDPETDLELRARGLRPDPEVASRSVTQVLPLPGGGEISLVITVSQPYTTRIATLDGLRVTLVFAGLIALVVSLVVGVALAQRLNVPLARLRRAAARLATGQLDERAPRSDVVEIDELAAQFNVMADRLSASLRTVEADRDRLREFVADVSHELRTPIAALRAFTELQRDGRVDESTRAEFLDRSGEQIARLEWMSTNLLDLSRIDAGIFPLDVRLGDLRDPIRSTVEAHAQLAEQRGVSLVSEVPSAPVLLRFDRERIVQLLNNLVGNGLKFTPRGGQVVVSLTDAPDAPTVSVRDSGPGIRAEEMPRIFDRFFRGTNVGEARASGSGLGLAIARSIVEMHGGTIEAASPSGAGAIFTVRLLRAPEAAPAASATTAKDS